MAVNLYKRSVLIGGGADSLDLIDGAGLNDGDFALVMTSSNIVYHYLLDADSGAAESSPNVISPDTNAGSKRWILQDTAATTGIFTDLTDGYIPYHVNDTTGLQNSNIYTDATKVLIGDTADTNVTQGLTINQGANDDQILSLKSSDIVHTVTTDTEADTYGLFRKYSATAGGLLVRGLTDVTSDGALVLEGIIGATDPTDTHSALILIGSKQSGTTTAALAAAETVAVFKNRTTNILTFLGNGSVILGTSTAVGTSGAKVLLIDSGTAPTTSPADAAQLWVADQNSVGGRARLHTLTEDGVSSSLALQSEVDVLYRDPDQGVAMTAAASGSSGITIADNDNIDFGTGNFALVWKGILPDWTPSAPVKLLWKMDTAPSPDVGFNLGIGYPSAGSVYFTIKETVYASSITNTFVDNTIHELVATVTVGATNTLVDLYFDGIAFGTQQTAANPGSVSNAIALKILGDLVSRTAGTVHHAYTLNLAPTAAEVLDMYRNGIPESWKWGSQTNLVTNDPTNWANGTWNTFNDVGDLSITASAGGQWCTLPVADAPMVTGKKYRISVTAANLVSTIRVDDNPGDQTNLLTISANGINSAEFTYTGAAGGLRCTSTSTTSSADLSSFTVVEIGATFALGPESWQSDKPYDLSSNNLTCSYPASGWSLTRPIMSHYAPTNILPNTLRKAMSGCTLENEGADLVTNGTVWTGANGATPPTGWGIAGGYATGVHTIFDSGDGTPYDACLKLAINAAPDAHPAISYSFSTTIGKLYKISFAFKHGTASNGRVKVGSTEDGGEYLDFNTLTDAAWTTRTGVFEATGTTAYIFIRTMSEIAGQFELYDTVTLYEQKRAYTAADTLGPDGTTKTSTLDWHIMEQDSTHGKGYYIDKYTKGANGAEYANLLSITNRADLDQYKGQPVAFGMAGYSVTATDNLKIQIYDGVGTTESAFWGADELLWKEITRTVSASATELTFRVLLDGDTSDVAYGSFQIAVNGSSIGQWNYAPKVGEIVYFQSNVNSSLLNGVAGWSDVAESALNLEIDSLGMIGKGIKAALVGGGVNDSGSAAAAVNTSRMIIGDQASGQGMTFSSQGLANDAIMRQTGWIGCTSIGDLTYYINATGANTLDTELAYRAIQS